jgi:hypothetical protein
MRTHLHSLQKEEEIINKQSSAQTCLVSLTLCIRTIFQLSIVVVAVIVLRVVAVVVVRVLRNRIMEYSRKPKNLPIVITVSSSKINSAYARAKMHLNSIV